MDVAYKLIRIFVRIHILGGIFMKKSFLVVLIMAVSGLLFFSGCSKETKWVGSGAMLKNFCGGSLYITGSKKYAPKEYGINIVSSDATSANSTVITNVEASFVDIDSYVPGTPCIPADKKKAENSGSSEQESPAECIVMSKTATEIDNSMDTDGALGTFYQSVMAKLTDEEIKECKAITYAPVLCSKVGDSAVSCSALISCGKFDVTVRYIFKGFDDEQCPDSALILAALKAKLPVLDKTPADDSKKDKKDKKADKKDKTDKKDKSNSTTPKQDTNKKQVPKKEEKKDDGIEDAPRG